MIKLRHVGIKIAHLDKSLKFYERLGNGTVVIKRGSEYTGKGRIRTVKLDNQIELIKGPWAVNHIALTVDSIDKYKLPADPIFSREDDKIKVCYITDLDGNIIELVEEKKRG